MKTFEYQILRFVPDRISGEFVNVGLVLFNRDESFLKGKVIDSVSRISGFFADIEGRSLSSTLKYIQNEFERYGKQVGKELNLSGFKNLDEITRQILPKDDSALIFTETREALDLNFETAFADLYNRLIQKHLKSDRDDAFYDHEVWTKMYKQYFEKHGVAKHLKSHTVQTKSDHMQFDHAIKNGKWNLFESVSFDLKREDSIRDKVYKWAGRIDELKSSKEPLDLYLLSRFPKNKNGDLNKFISEKLNQSLNGVKVTLVEPSEADTFVGKMKALLNEQEIGAENS